MTAKIPRLSLLSATALLGWVVFAGPNVPQLKPGMWSGGVGSIDGDRPEWHPLTGHFNVEGTRLSGTFNKPDGTELTLRGSYLDGRVKLKSTGGGSPATCRGTLEPGLLQAECSDDSELLLVHEEPPAGDHLDEYNGMYTMEDGGRWMVGKSKHLIFKDFTDGTMRVMYAAGKDRFIAGSAFAVPHPRQISFTFDRDSAGKISRLTVERTGEPKRHGSPCCTYREQPFSFTNDGLTLHGTLSLPESEGPHPAIVWVHGSGQATRSGAGFWSPFFVDQGFAFLAVDKRGVGESEGKYELPNGGHDNVPHMKRRSTDVAAAFRALGKRSDIDAARVGLVGASQAGWVMPQVADRENVAFTITISGGATQLSYEGRFSDLAGEMNSDASAASVEEIVERLRRHKAKDYDFRPHFAAQKCPGLWLYGAMDRSNPSQLCVEMLEQIKQKTGNDFTIKLYPGANHGLWECRYGGAAEYATLSNVVPELHRTIADWLQQKGFGPERTN